MSWRPRSDYWLIFLAFQESFVEVIQLENKRERGGEREGGKERVKEEKEREA